ncbi:MAG: CarD family transcriptional regulator [Candidatus Babeliales bacterium]
MFKLGDKIFYPGHGVALIEEATLKAVSNAQITFFKLKFLYKDMTIWVPVSNVQNLGIRFLSSKDDINNHIKELYNSTNKILRFVDFTPSGWNKRHKEYQLKIQKGKFTDLVYIYKDLMLIAQQKDLSFGEKGVLQTVEELLYQEIQSVTGKEKDFILSELHAPFKQFFIQDAPIQNVGIIS